MGGPLFPKERVRGGGTEEQGWLLRFAQKRGGTRQAQSRHAYSPRKGPLRNTHLMRLTLCQVLTRRQAHVLLK